MWQSVDLSYNRPMKRLIGSIIALAALVSTEPSAAQPRLKVERVVMLMRHGIRPPTSLQPIAAKYSPLAWPKWPVAPGLLTPHGAEGIARLAAFDRESFADSGLLPISGCPAPGQVTIRSSNVTRAIETAHAWSEGFAPGCNLTTQHPAHGAPDPLFHVLDSQPAWFDGQRAYGAALAKAPKGGLDAQLREVAPQLRRMGAILGCAPPACNLLAGSTIVARPHGRPQLTGPLDAASTAAESFLLEYLEGKPTEHVAWGRLGRDGIERLLVFNSIKFKYIDRPRFIAQAAAGPLAGAIVSALTTGHGSRITLLAGHDTNIADLGGLLDMHWRVASYPGDAIPPGSALGFELLSDRHGRQFVRAFFRAQTMEQLRRLQPLGADNRPYREYILIPGCSSSRLAFGCELAAFLQLVEARLH